MVKYDTFKFVQWSERTVCGTTKAMVYFGMYSVVVPVYLSRESTHPAIYSILMTSGDSYMY